jgi:hypothetical protein
MVACDCRLNQLDTPLSQALESARLILFHETAVADHVGGEDGREPPLHTNPPEASEPILAQVDAAGMSYVGFSVRPPGFSSFPGEDPVAWRAFFLRYNARRRREVTEHFIEGARKAGLNVAEAPTCRG